MNSEKKPKGGMNGKQKILDEYSEILYIKDIYHMENHIQQKENLAHIKNIRKRGKS